jgi:CubicO group peptidase (beta-lactamase class C family)
MTQPAFEAAAVELQRLMDETDVPGAALGVLHQGRMETVGLGVTSTEHPLPVTAETIFQLGSVSKVFTGTALMRLVADGRVELDAPVRTYLPAFRVADEDASAAVTVRHLLTHRVGWPGDIFDFPPEAYRSMAAFVEHMDRVPQIVPPGTIWSYANSGILVAGRILEVVTGQPYPHALHTLLLKPLGLAHTSADPGTIMTHRFAAGHLLKDGEAQIVRPWPLPGCADAEGNVAASAADLLRFAAFHLGDGASGGERLLPADHVEAMQSPQAVIWAPDEQMGLTWFVDDRGEERIVGHAGRTPGTFAELHMAPTEAFACVILTNADRGPEITRALRDVLFAHYLGDAPRPKPDPLPVRPDEVAPYLGRYEHPYFHLALALEDAQLVVHFGAQPHIDVLPQALPPMACAPCGEDQFVVLEGYLKECRLDIIRRPDGSIGWLRDHDTLYTRVGAG